MCDATNARSALIVETHPETVEGLRLILERERFDTTIASCGCEALALVRKNRFAIILADLTLPDMSGLDLLRLLRTRDKIWTPYVVVNGSSTIAVAVEALRLGAADFLETPVLQEALLHSVRSALGMERGPLSIDPRVANVLAIIQARFTERTLSAVSIARELAISHEHLSRLLKRDIGQTFGHLLCAVRLQHAKRLLMYPALSVKEIASLAGFRDTHDLDRYFRRDYGVTPLGYRRSIRGVN